MTHLLLPLMANSKPLVLGIIAVFALATLAALAAFGYSLWKQFRYSKATLPSLETEAAPEEAQEESAFALDSLEPLSSNAYVSSAAPEVTYDEIASRAPRRFDEEEVEEFALPPLPGLEEEKPVSPSPSQTPVEVGPLAPLQNYGLSEQEEHVFDSEQLKADEEADDDFAPVVSPKRGRGAHRAEKPPKTPALVDAPRASNDKISYVGKRRAAQEK